MPRPPPSRVITGCCTCTPRRPTPRSTPSSHSSSPCPPSTSTSQSSSSSSSPSSHHPPHSQPFTTSSLQSAIAATATVNERSAPPVLDFLYPGFGFFSRSLPPVVSPSLSNSIVTGPPPPTPLLADEYEPESEEGYYRPKEGRKLFPSPSPLSHSPSAVSASFFGNQWRSTMMMTSTGVVGSCICGRMRETCLRCRGKSTSAQHSRIPTPLPQMEPTSISDRKGKMRQVVNEPDQDSATNPSTSVEPSNDSLTYFRDLLQVLSSSLPSSRSTAFSSPSSSPVSTLSPSRRKLRRKRSSLLSTASTPLELIHQLSSHLERDSVWNEVGYYEKLDSIRLFSRITRLPFQSSLSDSLVPDFAVKKELEELREKAGERIEYFLNRLEGGEERSKLSEAGLWIDSYSLRDLSHRIPSPYGEVSGKFEESVRLVFGGWETGAAGGKEKDKKTKLQAIRSGLSSLFDSWERLPLGGGGEAAFKLIYEYDLGSIFEIVTTTLEPSTLATSKPSKWRQEVGYNDLFKREYGSLLGRLKPSPSEWLEQGEDEPGVVERGSHLIEYLSRSGSAGEARKIWEKIEQFRNRHEVVEQETRELESKLGLGDEARLTGLTALVDGLLMERFYEDANRLTAELEELAKQVGKEESKLEIEAYRILVKLASNQGRQNILVKLHKHLEAIKLRSTSLTPPSPIETFVRRLRTKSARSDVQAVQSLFTEFRSCSDWAQASREDQSRIWSQVILAQTRTNDVESAIQSLQSLVESGLRPPLASINTILFGFARRGDVETVDKLFQQLIRGDFDRLKPDVGSWNALILARIVVKDPSAASSIIYEMRRSSIEPNRQTWTTLMSGLVDTSQWRQAFEIYRYLEQHPSPSMRPDTATINVILKACVLTATPASSVLSLFRQLLIRGFRPNMMTYTLVLQSLTTAGLMDLAEELYLMMDRPSSNSTPSSLTPALPISMTPVRPDQFIYSTLIAGYLKQDERDKARACMQEMRRRGIEPSSITLAIVVGSRLNERSTPMKVKQLVAEARRLMVEEGSGLTRMRKSQSWRRDKKLAMGDEAIAVFAPIFRSAAKQGLAEAALELLEEVQSRRRTENEVPVELYTMLMDSFRRVDDQEAAADNVKTVWDRVYEAVAERFMAVQTSSDKSTPHLPSSRFTAHQLTTSRLDLRIDPAQASILCVPLTIYLESLAQVGRHHLFGITWRALARQGFSFDASNWNVLALYFARDLELERAFWISEYILCRPLDDKSPIPSPAKFEADLASVTRSSAIARTPSRLFQLRQHERDRHSKKPLDLNSLLPSSASTSSPSTELDIYTKFDEALTRRNAMFWHPFGSLLEALEKALETLTVSGEVKVETGGGEGTGLREVAALEQIKEKLVLEHPRTMEAIELWRTRGERKEREKERYLSVRGSRRW